MVVHSSLGDAYRQVDRDNDAIIAYGNAIDISNKLGKPRWEIYFYRGMIYERQKNFIKMEQDFQKALKLSPKQPDVLNFLGYSLVEQRKKQWFAQRQKVKAVEHLQQQKIKMKMKIENKREQVMFDEFSTQQFVRRINSR